MSCELSIRRGAKRACTVLGFLGLGFAVSAAAAPTTYVREDGVPVTKGAEWVSAPVHPTFKTVDMQRLPPAPEWKPGDPIVEIPRQFFGDPNAPTPVPSRPPTGHDLLAELQRNFQPTQRGGGFTTPILNFNVLAGTASPNDPTGDIGTLQFVAAINGPGGGQFAAYDKVTGTQVVAPTLMEGLGSGGACATGLGDPIVIFDELASRWVLTEFSTQAGQSLCVYISNTDDLSGTVTWTRYAFALPAFPDYPKYGVWPDAYYVGANEGGTGGQRPLYALDRVRMLAGQAATLQRLTTPSLAGFGFQMIQPADITGTELPPDGAPGLFMRHRDDEAHNVGSNDPNQDFVQLYEFRVDWTTPANSSITGPIDFAMPEFSSNLNGLSAFNAFPQPSGQKLDPLRETVMHRLAYRNLGSYEALVGNMVTDLFLGAGSLYPDDTGGVRWFELRRSLGPADLMFRNGFEDAAQAPESPQGDPWALYQVGTFAPADGTPAEQSDRWMAGSSIDSSGNIALAYDVVRQAPAISASVRYTGRLESDPLGVMTEAETTAIAGSGSASNERWGDYSDMGVDPVDGCTFWYVTNYVVGGARTNRAVSFRHDACGTPTFTLGANPLSVSVCADTGSTVNAPPITLNVGSVNGYTVPVDLTFLNPLPSGITGNMTPPQVTPPGTSTLQLGANNTAPAGANTITVRGTSGAITRDRTVTLNVTTGLPAQATLTAPANGATGVPTQPTFTWTAVAGATSYLIEAADNAGFSPTLFSQTVTTNSFTPGSALPAAGTVFWRVTPINACGNGPVSAVFTFTTVAEYCRTPALAVPDNNATGVNDVFVIPAGAALTDLNVLFVMTHTWTGDLRVTLTKSGGPTIVLIDRPGVPATASGCNGDNPNLVLDDEEPTRTAEGNCINDPGPAYTNGATYRPNNVLSGFDGQTLSGTWTLNIADLATQDTGTVTRWCLIPTP